MLENKVALVTGGARGIGAQIVRTLSSYGATVIINYSSSADAALALADSLTKEGAKVDIYPCNVADFAASKEMIEKVIEKHGQIDILVNNAGITKDNLTMMMTEKEFDDVIDINLKGSFNCMKHVTRSMLKKKSGRIINISSIVGIRGNAGQINYCATKAGVIGMTKALAKEIGSRGITVNAVAPGYIDTDMTKVLPEEVTKKLLSEIPLGKIGTTTDIAETVAFLASDRAGYITGQVIQVDGGMGI